MKLGLLTRAFSFCLAAACGDLGVVDDDDSAGSLVVDWAITVGGSEADCDDAGAVFFKVAVRSLHRDATSSFTTNCDRSPAALSLYPDEYEGEATLLGRSGALTRAVPLGTFSVSEGEVTSIAVDFSSGAFQ